MATTLFVAAPQAQAQDGAWGFASTPYTTKANCTSNNAAIVSVTPNPSQALGQCSLPTDVVTLPVSVTYSLNGNNVYDLMVAYGFGTQGANGTIYYDDCLVPAGGTIPAGMANRDGDACLDGASGASGTFTVTRNIQVKCDLDNDGAIDSGTEVSFWAAWQSNDKDTLYDVATPQCFGPSGGVTLSIAPKVTVAKVSTGDVGTFGFTVSGAQNSGSFALTTTAENTPVTYASDLLPVRAGAGFNSVTITETVPAGWTSDAVCTGLTEGVGYTDDGNGTVVILGSSFRDTNPQQQIACTFTNTRATATLTLDKVVENGGAGTALPSAWTIFASPDGTLANAVLSGPGASGSTDVTGTVNAGTYTIAETPANPDYTLSLACTGAADTNPNDGLTLASGENVTCTLTNRYNKGSLTLVKSVTNDNGGTAAAGAFTLSYNGTAATQGVPVTLTPGTYSLTETALTGYQPAATPLACSVNGTGGSALSGSTLTLAAGDAVTCTFYNDDDAPTYDMAKTADPVSAAAGDTVTYTLAFTNNGPWAISNLTPVDTSLTGLSAIDCGGGAASIATLASGASASCTATYLVTQADVDGGGNATAVDTGTCASGLALVNTASSSAEETDGTALTETSLANNGATVCLPVRNAAITLDKTADVATYGTLGETVTYSFEVENTGNVTLANVSVTDPLTGLSAITPAPVSLAPGASQIFTATLTVTQDHLDAGSIANTATASGTPPVGDAVTDTDSVTLTAAQQPAITLDKTADV
ncbi:DUF11 domain-containing protein, partial [Aliigemmobacter aestuarii]